MARYVGNGATGARDPSGYFIAGSGVQMDVLPSGADPSGNSGNIVPVPSTAGHFVDAGSFAPGEPGSGNNDFLDSYADGFNSIFGSGWSDVGGNMILDAVGAENLVDMGAWEALGWTTLVSIPAGIAIFAGGEIILGVGTIGAPVAAAFSTMVTAVGAEASGFAAYLFGGGVSGGGLALAGAGGTGTALTIGGTGTGLITAQEIIAAGLVIWMTANGGTNGGIDPDEGLESLSETTRRAQEELEYLQQQLDKGAAKGWSESTMQNLMDKLLDLKAFIKELWK